MIILGASAPLSAGAPNEDPAGGLPAPQPQISLRPAPMANSPDFALPTLDGSPLTLREHGGRIVLVHFFATWCEPCRTELAALSRLAAGPLGPRIAVLAIDVAEVPDRVRRFLAAAPVPFPVALDTDRAVSRAWDVSALPTTFVLGPELRPRLFVEGDIDWAHPAVQSTLQALDSGASQEKPKHNARK